MSPAKPTSLSRLSKLERWNRTHELLRTTAAKLLRARGLTAPSVADVMKGARLTVGGFYGHWDSKEALFDEALGETLRGTMGQLLAQAGDGAPRARLVAILRRYLSR